MKSLNISFTTAKLPKWSLKFVKVNYLHRLKEAYKTSKVNETINSEPFFTEIFKKLELLDREQLIKHFISTEFNRYLTYYEGAKGYKFFYYIHRQEKRI